MENENLEVVEQAEQIANENSTQKKEFTHRPKWAFDSEYMTERLREVQFLAEKGITHTFIRKTPDYNVSQYKYKKTPALFAALVEYYTRLEVEREYRRKRQLKKQAAEVAETEDSAQEENVVTPDVIKQMQMQLERYANQISEIKNKLQDDTE